jgi:hypothetical protein
MFHLLSKGRAPTVVGGFSHIRVFRTIYNRRMGDAFDSQDINMDLLGKRVTLHSPYFPSAQPRVEGEVKYVEQSSEPVKIVVLEDNDKMIMVNVAQYRVREID